MEIVTEKVQTGRELKAEILAEFGSEEALRVRASAGDAEAQESVAILEILEKEPARLASRWKTTIVSDVSPKDVEALTEKRLALLDRVHSGQKVTVTQLAVAVKRDKKNVSEDLKVLTRMGFVRLERAGREAFPRPVANEVRIVLGAGLGRERQAKAGKGRAKAMSAARHASRFSRKWAKPRKAKPTGSRPRRLARK